MRHFRRAAPVVVAVLVVLLGLPLTITAADAAVTRSEMEAFVFAIIGTATVTVFGAVWVLLNAIVGRAERTFSATAERVEASVAKVAEALAAHDTSPWAHRAASEHNHQPIVEAIDRLEAKVEEILHDCERRSCAPRDPLESPHPRRASDPPDADLRSLRGQE